MSLLPNKKQWNSWSLPSKLTAIGALLGFLSFGFYFVEKAFNIFDWSMQDDQKTVIKPDLAVDIFVSMCDAAWIISQVDNDYGLDLRVEVTKGGYVTGEEFTVQVKGRGRVSNEALPSAKIKQSTINYWLRKLTPTMIVIVDTTARTVYYDWLEFCYSGYPEFVKFQSDVELNLRYSSNTHDIKKEVHAYLSRYYQSMSNDMERLSQGIFLSNLLFSISALHRLSAGMAIDLQRIEPSNPEEFKQFLQRFFYAFASHDKLMEGLRSGAFGHLPQKQSRFFWIVKHKLSRYDEVRNKFIVYKGETADGDYMVEPRYKEISAWLLPMIEVLEDIEETLGLAQVLNKSLVRRVSK